MTGIHFVQVYCHTAQGASTAQVNAMCRNLKIGTVMGRTQACAIVAWFSAKSVCRKLPPELIKSTSGSRCGEVSMSTPGAEFARSGGKRLPFWQETPDAGTKLLVQFPPPRARCWRRARSRAHQVSGKRQTPVLLWTALCSTRRRSSTVCPGKWKCKHVKEWLGIRPARVWRKVSLPTPPRRQVSADQ